MKKRYLFVFLASVFCFQVFAQNKKGDKLFKYYNYAEAIPYYLNAYNKGSTTEQNHAIQKLADCYRLTNNAPKARQWYEKAVMLDTTVSKNWFYLGQSLRSLGLYDKAANAFSTFNRQVPDDELGQRYYQYCVDIEPWLNLPPMAEIKNIEELNSKYADFGPVFYRDGIVFTSDREENANDKINTYGWTNHSYLNLFYTIPEYYKVFWNGLPEPKKMSQAFNQNYHDGPVCFSDDNRMVYITRTVSKNGKKLDGNIKTHLLKIYYAEIDGDKHLDYKEFAYNSDDYSVGHPALSEDGQRLIFSSDMPGGKGGSDLYICTMKDGAWGEPVNLGEPINSEGDEVFPHWANDSVLFFSSDGHLGYGGLDIFQTNFEKNAWTEPENLKRPLNSSYDDFGIVFKENLNEGMFSSNRPEGKGNDDIYGFRNLERKNVVDESVLQIKGRVVDESNVPLVGATVFMLDPITNQVKVLITDEDGWYSDEAAYNQNYAPKAMKDGYMEDCLTFRSPAGEVELYNVPRDLILTKLEVDQVFKVENIYYDLDKWYIRKDAEAPLNDLVAFMKKYPITAELSSHTDSRASDEYNRELSQKRAESAVRYIILQGIAPSRITAKGYGESQLVNKCADGVDCTEEEHQANRRTEFRITSIGSWADGYEIDLSLYKHGDIVPANILGSQFFTDCMK
jgi:outer membrane protein OmpA-like peptidoglycan-associated protein/tetratricopeptide (TPR) repeat protein